MQLKSNYESQLYTPGASWVRDGKAVAQRRSRGSSRKVYLRSSLLYILQRPRTQVRLFRWAGIIERTDG